MLFAPFQMSVDHLPTDQQRTEQAGRRYAELEAARHSRAATTVGRRRARLLGRSRHRG